MTAPGATAPEKNRPGQAMDYMARICAYAARETVPVKPGQPDPDERLSVMGQTSGNGDKGRAGFRVTTLQTATLSDIEKQEHQ